MPLLTPDNFPVLGQVNFRLPDPRTAASVRQEVEPVPAPKADGDTTADTTAGSASAQLPVMEVDESDDEVTFKTPPNVIKRRLSRPAASTPQTAALARSGPTTPATPKPAPQSAALARSGPTTPATPKPTQKAATTPKSAAKKVAKSPKSVAGTPKTPKTPKSMAKKTPPKSPKQLSVGKKTPSKKTPPKSGRKR